MFDLGSEALILLFYYVWGLALHSLAHRAHGHVDAYLARHSRLARIVTPVNVDAVKHYTAHLIIGFMILH